jgi:hypothetical protein
VRKQTQKRIYRRASARSTSAPRRSAATAAKRAAHSLLSYGRHCQGKRDEAAGLCKHESCVYQCGVVAQQNQLAKVRLHSYCERNQTINNNNNNNNNTPVLRPTMNDEAHHRHRLAQHYTQCGKREREREREREILPANQQIFAIQMQKNASDLSTQQNILINTTNNETHIPKVCVHNDYYKRRQ